MAAHPAGRVDVWMRVRASCRSGVVMPVRTALPKRAVVRRATRRSRKIRLPWRIRATIVARILRNGRILHEKANTGARGINGTSKTAVTAPTLSERVLGAPRHQTDTEQGPADRAGGGARGAGLADQQRAGRSGEVVVGMRAAEPDLGDGAREVGGAAGTRGDGGVG